MGQSAFQLVRLMPVMLGRLRQPLNGQRVQDISGEALSAPRLFAKMFNLCHELCPSTH
jgi:hypothetical protein